ncbi:MAG: class I SAM-dependent methyltransferase [Chloroflexota bacterium]|nr:class I SAM-dependent methyltransferase [Chloroflexota bacterium]
MTYQRSAYDEAIKSGQYQKVTGLTGKYDNVRRLWEDEVLRLFPQPYIQRLVDERQARGKGIRILDLGCGSGDGFELLMSVKRDDRGLSNHATIAIEPQLLEFYKGVDLNPGLIAQAEDIYGRDPRMTFVERNFNDVDLAKDEPYDLFLASYGTPSHNSHEPNARLLANIATNGRNGSLVIADWLGRYSYEWWDLWDSDLRREKWMNYVISYIYPEEERKHRQLSNLDLALLSRREVLSIVARARRLSGVGIRVRRLFDRSVLVGRHIDTRDYNPHAQPVRQQVNSLFEPNIRTDLESLLLRYVPKEGFDEVNRFYSTFHDSWNALVRYVIALLQHRDGVTSGPEPRIEGGHPRPVRRAMADMRRLISYADRCDMGDCRANCIEPQLGYALRELEMRLQRGLGCGHGLVAILEVEK